MSIIPDNDEHQEAAVLEEKFVQLAKVQGLDVEHTTIRYGYDEDEKRLAFELVGPDTRTRKRTVIRGSIDNPVFDDYLID